MTTSTDPASTDPASRGPAADDAVAAAAALLGSLEQPDPYPAYARLRAAAPVHVPPVGPVLLTSYAAVTALLHASAAGKDSDARFRLMGLADWKQQPGLAMMFTSMLQVDPPQHTRLRALVSRVFTPRRVEEMRPAVQSIVDDLMAGLRERAGEPVDLMAEWAFPLPVAVIGDLLGVPREDWTWFAGVSHDFALTLEPGLDAATLARCNTAATQMASYFSDLVAERRRRPTGDLTSALTTVEGLGEEELTTMMALLFGAGFETTTHLLGNAVVALVRHPDEVGRWRADPGLTPDAVEELLRYDSPVQLNSRVLHEAVDVCGRRLAAGRVVFSLLGAANRDPDRYPDPDRLDLGRRGPRGMGFGAGPHYCLGAALARLEAALALPPLLTAFDVDLDGPPVPRPGLGLHGFGALPVRLTART